MKPRVECAKFIPLFHWSIVKKRLVNGLLKINAKIASEPHKIKQRGHHRVLPQGIVHSPKEGLTKCIVAPV